MSIVALDLGSSGCKGYVVNLDGKIVFRSKSNYKTYYSGRNFVEQKPKDWLKAALGCLKEIGKFVSKNKIEIEGICIDATVGTLVPISKDKECVLENIPLYSDMRALDEMMFVKEIFGEEFLYKKTGNPITPVPTLLKMIWYKRNMPKIYEKIWKFIYHKDYIVGKLLNEWKEPFTDFTDASATMAFDIDKLVWIEEILEETGIGLEKMVEVKPSTEIIGELNNKIAKEFSLKKTIPILVGAGDCSATLYGAGAIEDKTGDVYLGTSPEIDLTHEELRLDPKFRLPVRSHGIKGFWYSTATTISGVSINWFWDLISYNKRANKMKSIIKRLEENAWKIPAGSNGLIYLPYIIGERTPLLDPFARAAFIGLDITHNLEHMYRAILEGISFALRENYEIYSEDMKILVKQLAFCGGGAQNSLLRKIIASNLKREILLLENPLDCAAIGDTIIASIAMGEIKSIKDSKEKFLKIISKEEVDERFAQIYDEIYLLYKDSYKKLKTIFKSLRKFRN